MLKFGYKNNGKKLVFKLFGVGNGGINTIETVIERRLEGLELIAVDTDTGSLESSSAHRKIQIGGSLTSGRGTGGTFSTGREAAENSYKEFFEASSNADVIFITAGFGGGAGSGATPVIARAAKETGSLVVVLITKPFSFEGKNRLQQASEGVMKLGDNVDSLIIIPNDRLLDIMTEDTSFLDAFKITNEVICEVASALYLIVTRPSLIKLDFADVRSVLKGGGECMLGFGDATGRDKALRAVEMALASPLMDKQRLMNSKNVLVSMIGGRDLGLFEVNSSLKSLQQMTNFDANSVLGVSIDENFNERVRVTVLAGGTVAEKSESEEEQQQLDILPPPRGRFDKADPTIIDGEELDIPTFIRKSKKNWFKKVMGRDSI